MRETIRVLCVLAGVSTLATAAGAQDTRAAECTVALLSGRFGLLQTGFDSTGRPRNGVGVVTFDGRGAWSLVVTEVTGATTRRIVNPNGTYTVRPDCTGSASLANTPFGVANWEFVIVDDGREVLQVVTTPPRGAVTWLLKKQFTPDR